MKINGITKYVQMGNFANCLHKISKKHPSYFNINE